MSNRILAIDPGCDVSAYLLWEGGVLAADTIPNEELRQMLLDSKLPAYEYAIEMVACYGMPVGKEVFETCVWIGRFCERMIEPRLIYRRDIKLHLCGSARAKDGNIRQALLDKYGLPGTKKAKGLTYGISGHLWSALAVACYALENPIERIS